ncbi:hypothetical protein TSA1_08265 [Bradyrhizobium nitroreducens]|uniref:Uncharacterized protein n=1 Tax=Bradyrhizobium nitroreducens TaxID=709803 RepID=A0A2M6U838_9BRAD|nr:hypothetical protein TSA1_08265 [Bradyrhizobium nitroreducens]
MPLTLIEFPNDLGGVKANGSPQLDQLNDVYSTLARFKMGYPGLVDPKFVGEINLTESRTLS